MLSLVQASELTGLSTPELLLLALTGRLPFTKDPETRRVFFDPATLKNMRNEYAKQFIPNF